MSGIREAPDASCFLQPLDKDGVAIIKFSQKASKRWEIYWDSETQTYLNLADGETLPLCRPNLTEISIYNQWLEDATRTVPYTAVLVFGLMLVTCGIIFITAALISTMLRLKRNFLEWQNMQKKIQNGSRADRVAVNEFISKYEQLIEKQNRSFEVNVQMLMLQVTQIKDIGSLSPVRNCDLEAQIERATRIIDKSKDYCGFSHLLSLTKPSSAGVTLKQGAHGQDINAILERSVPQPLALQNVEETNCSSSANVTEDDVFLPMPDQEMLRFPELPSFNAFTSPLKLHNQVNSG